MGWLRPRSARSRRARNDTVGFGVVCSITMPAWITLLLLCAAPALAGSPAMVTTVQGEVALVEGEDRAEAPSPPFLLEDDRTLALGEGALVVVLYQGHATQIAGPATVDRASLAPREGERVADADVLDDLLGRHTSTAPTGASRGVGDLKLVRPVPGSPVLDAPTIAWRCDDCGPQQVQVVDLLAGETLWTSEGHGSLAYDGPDLPPGAYSVVIAGRDHAFTVAEADRREQVRAAAKAARRAADDLPADAGPAMRTAVVASVYLQAGLPTEALYVIDAALAEHPDDERLKALREAFEARAGLAP